MRNTCPHVNVAMFLYVSGSRRPRSFGLGVQYRLALQPFSLTQITGWEKKMGGSRFRHHLDEGNWSLIPTIQLTCTSPIQICKCVSCGGQLLYPASLELTDYGFYPGPSVPRCQEMIKISRILLHRATFPLNFGEKNCEAACAITLRIRRRCFGRSVKISLLSSERLIIG